MTLGSFLLLAMDPSPASTHMVTALAARGGVSDFDRAIFAAINDTALPLETGKWRNIVIHDSTCKVAAGSHFVIQDLGSSGENGQVLATNLWRTQKGVNHVDTVGHDYNPTSIAIIVAGDLSASPPSPFQMRSLKALVDGLRQRLGIEIQHVYLHHDLTGGPCPGESFPVGAFRSSMRELTER
jgi:hypothetical protein